MKSEENTSQLLAVSRRDAIANHILRESRFLARCVEIAGDMSVDNRACARETIAILEKLLEDNK